MAHHDARCHGVHPPTCLPRGGAGRFLQHVLPTGFMPVCVQSTGRKIRHYGFLNANATLSLDTVRDLVCAFYDMLRDALPTILPPRPATPRCPRCQGILRSIWFFPPGVPAPLQEAPSG